MDPLLIDRMNYVYEEWREVEGRARQMCEMEQICATLPDTPAGKLEREYQQLRAQFSPAYFAGSSANVGPRLTPHLYQQGHRQTVWGGVVGWLMSTGV